MGQGQSSSRDGEDTSAQKTDYYELLGVSLYATDEEIKKAYRKKALELHPDRNYGNTEDATRLFAGVQTAYEVLSNSQERAWYDSHRDEILRDGVDVPEAYYEFNVRMTTAEDITRMYMSFDGRSKFDDSPDGFFTVLQDFFKRLATEEVLTSERDGVKAPSYPSFGSSVDSFEDVVRPFYAAWSSFSTKKTFSWKDKYRLSDAPDRRTRRLMEKENKKAREQGVRDFNSAVRALVSFIKRRDTRYSSVSLTGENRHEDLRARAAVQAAKDRAAHQAKAEEYTVPSWAQSEGVDEEFASEESESAGDEVYECVICNKTFKSESQYEAHEMSKKHRKAVYVVERAMRKEDKALGLDVLPEKSAPAEMHHGGEDRTDGEQSGADDEPQLETAEVKSLATTEQSPVTAQSHEYTSESLSWTPPPSNAFDVGNSTNATTALSDGAESPNLEASASVQGEDNEDDLNVQLSAQDLDSRDTPKLGKAKQKRAKKEAARTAGTAQASMDHECVVCGAGFASKNQLFKHINQTGHARRPEPSIAERRKKR